MHPARRQGRHRTPLLNSEGVVFHPRPASHLRTAELLEEAGRAGPGREIRVACQRAHHAFVARQFIQLVLKIRGVPVPHVGQRLACTYQYQLCPRIDVALEPFPRRRPHHAGGSPGQQGKAEQQSQHELGHARHNSLSHFGLAGNCWKLHFPATPSARRPHFLPHRSVGRGAPGTGTSVACGRSPAGAAWWRADRARGRDPSPR